MYHVLVGAMLALAIVVGLTGLRAARRHWQRAQQEPLLTWRDGPAALMLILRLLVAGGLFGFGLAMLLDRWLGGWGIMLATAICATAGLLCYRSVAPAVREDTA